MISAISGFYKTSTLKGNHTSGCGTPTSFSILEYLCSFSFVIFIYTLPNLISFYSLPQFPLQAQSALFKSKQETLQGLQVLPC